MTDRIPEPRPTPRVALAYDELPEGSALRRDYDGRGGVTITAPAGELSAPVRRAALRSAMVSALLASAACLLVVGYLVLDAARSNRFDPALRGAAAVALAVLAGGGRRRFRCRAWPSHCGTGGYTTCCTGTILRNCAGSP